MNSPGYGNNSSHMNVGGRQLIITSHLLKSIADMQNIDELFLWLSHAIVQQFGIQMMQIWVVQADNKGQFFMQSRAIASQYNSSMYPVALNELIATLAGNMLTRRVQLALNHVSNLFSYYQATIFGRYGLHYCFGEYLNSNGLLPSAQHERPTDSTLLPLQAAALLLSTYAPSADVLKSVDRILRFAVQLAETHHLLLPASDVSRNIRMNRVSSLQQEFSPGLTELIPSRREDLDLMRSSNPLASSVDIADKQARRLYVAIDGRKNLQELGAMTRMDMKEMILALRILLTLKRVQLYDTSGQQVASSLFFDDL